MNEKIIKQKIFEILDHKLKVYGLKSSEIKDNFDFVRSGLMDSMSFVNFIGDLEKVFNVEIDFDEVLEDESLTTMKGVVRLFNNG